MSRLSEAHGSIDDRWSQLRETWGEVRAEWRDAVALRFEREWWQQLEEVAPRWLDALAEVDEVLERALADTED